MNHLKEAKETLALLRKAKYTNQTQAVSQEAIAHALIAIAEQLQAGNSEPSPAVDWFIIHDNFIHCRFCGILQTPHLRADWERHEDYCQRGQWVLVKKQGLNLNTCPKCGNVFLSDKEGSVCGGCYAPKVDP